MNPLALIPAPYRAAAGLAFTWLALFLFFAWGHHSGSSSVQKKWDAERAAQAAAIADTRIQHADAAARVVTRYVDRVRTVREVGETIVREVPVYVPVEADADCRIPVGFVRLHDAAAAGDGLPQPAGAADAAPAGVALSAVAETVAGNYTACHETGEQLSALQAWATGVSSGSR